MRFQVNEADTAVAVGSGDVPVLSTPRLLAWMEAATLQGAAPLLAPGQTTVGVMVHISHRHATRVGETVRVDADVVGRDGSKIGFHVEVFNESETLVADGEIIRAAVDRERFLRGGSSERAR